MAMFDRRLLAYFDDAGLGSSGTTIIDRVADYQKDLSEIERELVKYQHLIAGRRGKGKIKARNRDGWITAHRDKEQPSVKDTYRNAAEAAKQSYEEEPERTEAPKKRPSVKPGSGRRESKMEKRSSKLEHRPSVVHQGARASIRPSIAGHGGRRPSELHRDLARPSLAAGASSGASVGHLWAQLDRLIKLPRGSSLGQYYLKVSISPEHPGAIEQSTEAKPGIDLPDHPEFEDCQIRQQLKVIATADVKYLHITVIRKGAAEEIVGKLRIDVWDERSHKAETHEILDVHGQPTGALLKLRIPEKELLALRMGTASGNLAVAGATGGDAGGRKSLAPRASIKPRESVSGHRPSVLGDVGGRKSVSGKSHEESGGSRKSLNPRRASVAQPDAAAPEKEEKRKSMKPSEVGMAPADIGRRASQQNLNRALTKVPEDVEEENDDEGEEEEEEDGGGSEGAEGGESEQAGTGKSGSGDEEGSGGSGSGSGEEGGEGGESEEDGDEEEGSASGSD